MTAFIHTADWQIGKPYARVSDIEKRTALRQARIAAIARIGKIAKEREASFVLVAGDLFDTPTVSKATVSLTCGEIGQIGLPVLVIPGNHDHGGPGSIWEQEFFLSEKESLAPNLRILLTPEPVELDDAVILPCPLLRRHESIDPTMWLRDLDEESLLSFGDKPRIVLAHGSTQDFNGSGSDDEEGPGGVANLLDLSRLPLESLDYVALGDWHGTKEIGGKAWYAGTPEPDRFPKGASNDPGNLLVVKTTRAGSPEIETVRTASLGWHQIEFEFASDADIENLNNRFDELVEQRAGRDLLLLNLSGSLGIEATTRLEQLLETWESRLLRLKLANETTIAPTEAEIEALTQRPDDPLIASVADQLLEKSKASDFEEAEIARIALRELHACAASLD